MFPSSPPPPSPSASCRSGAWESRCGLQLAWHVMKDNAVWKPLETDLHPFTGLWPVTRLSDNIHPTYSNIIQLPRTLCKSSSWLLPSVGPSVVADCSVASSSVLTCWRVASKKRTTRWSFFSDTWGIPAIKQSNKSGSTKGSAFSSQTLRHHLCKSNFNHSLCQTKRLFCLAVVIIIVLAWPKKESQSIYESTLTGGVQFFRYKMPLV